MEEKLNTINTEIVEDMPDFEETTAENPCESEKSVCDCTDDSENAILNAENSEDSAETEGETEEKGEKSAGSAEKKAETKKAEKKPFKSNLPTGFSFNPLVMAIKPFYDKLIAEDEIFASVVKEREGRKEKPKSLSECADYIMSEAYNYAKSHKQGNCGFAGFPDEEMYRLIQHYYNEEFMEVHKFNDARASFSTTPTSTPTAKGKDKPKPKANVIDITKAITAKPKAEDGKKVKREKKKDNLLAGFVPMERPDAENYEKEGRKGSREQAKSVEQMDLFADFFAE